MFLAVVEKHAQRLEQVYTSCMLSCDQNVHLHLLQDIPWSQNLLWCSTAHRHCTKDRLLPRWLQTASLLQGSFVPHERVLGTRRYLVSGSRKSGQRITGNFFVVVPLWWWVSCVCCDSLPQGGMQSYFGLRPSSHRMRSTLQHAHANYGIHYGQWECSHSLQATSKGLRANVLTRPVWTGP